MQSGYFLILWTVSLILMAVFNGPVYARMLRAEPQAGETPAEARARRRRGKFLLASTAVGVILGYAMILFIFPLVLGA